MAHPRKLIRQAVVTALTGVTAAGTRVQATRVEPHGRKLPAISVYTLRESIDADASGDTNPRELHREMRLEIVGWVVHTTAIPVDDALDNLAEQIEAAMDADPQLGGVATDSMLDDTLIQVLAEDNAGGDPLIGVITLTYVIHYLSTPTVAGELDDFLSVAAPHRIVGAVDETAIHDEFVVQETPP